MKYQNEFWARYFRYYDILLKLIPYQELMQKLSDHLDSRADDLILDLGCGTGNFQYFVNEGNFIGFDNSQAALKILAEKFPNTHLVQGSLEEKLPFKDNEFDKIISNNVLYTINRENWDFVIKEIYRVLKPGGLVVVSNLTVDFVPKLIYKDHLQKSITKRGYFNTMIDILKLLYPTIQMFRYNKIIKDNNSTGNYSFLSEDEQKKAFERNGFKPQACSELVYSNQAILDKFVK